MEMNMAAVVIKIMKTVKTKMMGTEKKKSRKKMLMNNN